MNGPIDRSKNQVTPDFVQMLSCHFYVLREYIFTLNLNLIIINFESVLKEK